MRILLTVMAILANCRGATAIEYALILSLVFLAIIGGVSIQHPAHRRLGPREQHIQAAMAGAV